MPYFDYPTLMLKEFARGPFGSTSIFHKLRPRKEKLWGINGDVTFATRNLKIVILDLSHIISKN